MLYFDGFNGKYTCFPSLQWVPLKFMENIKQERVKITPRGFPDVSLVTRIFSIKQSNELVLLAVS